MIIPVDSTYSPWQYVEVARYVPRLERVIRLRDEEKNPVMLERDEVTLYSQKYNNIGIYTSVSHFNSKNIDEAVRLSSLYFDMDAENLDDSLRDANKLYWHLADIVDKENIRLYFTGSKGFHIEVEALALGISPSNELHVIFRHIAEQLRDELQLSTMDFAVYDCLAGETLVMTPDGDIPISELAGKTATLLTKGSGTTSRWVEAPVLEIGQDRLQKITLSRHGIQREIYATSSHRWFRRHRRTLNDNDHVYEFTEVTTNELKAGDRLESSWTKSSAPRIKHMAAGIPHGVVFGDGTIDHTGASRVALYEDKKMALAKYFPDTLTGRYTNPVECLVYLGLSSTWKDLPLLKESTAYIYGFLAGWFAADGDVTKDGVVRLTNVDKDVLEYATILFRSVGIDVLSLKSTEIKGKEFNASEFLYSLTIRASDLSHNFFLIPEHRERWDRQRRRDADWKVVSVEETDRFEPVYCAVVDGTERFTLSGNLLTGNSRRMWRLPYSIHQKTNLYKTELPSQALSSSMDKIKEFASENRRRIPRDPSFSVSGNEWYKEAIVRHETQVAEKQKELALRRMDLFNKYGTTLLDGHSNTYIQRVWNTAIEKLKNAKFRNDTLSQQAYKVYLVHLESNKALEDVTKTLYDIAMEIGLEPRETNATLESAERAARHKYETNPQTAYG